MVDAARLAALGVEVMSDATGGSVRLSALGIEAMSRDDTAAELVVGGLVAEVMSRTTIEGEVQLSGLVAEVMSNAASAPTGLKLAGEPTYVGFGRGIKVFNI